MKLNHLLLSVIIGGGAAASAHKAATIDVIPDFVTKNLPSLTNDNLFSTDISSSSSYGGSRQPGHDVLLSAEEVGRIRESVGFLPVSPNRHGHFIPTTTIVDTTKPHIDHVRDADGYCHPVTTSTAFIVLNNNNNARFSINGMSIPVTKGSLVRFNGGDHEHHTIIESGSVQLLGPFEGESLRPVGDECNPDLPPLTYVPGSICRDDGFDPNASEPCCVYCNATLPPLSCGGGGDGAPDNRQLEDGPDFSNEQCCACCSGGSVPGRELIDERLRETEVEEKLFPDGHFDDDARALMAEYHERRLQFGSLPFCVCPDYPETLVFGDNNCPSCLPSCCDVSEPERRLAAEESSGRYLPLLEQCNCNGTIISITDECVSITDECVACDPTGAPTKAPTSDPTGSPTSDPTVSPTSDPTGSPTSDPTGSPIESSKSGKDGKSSSAKSAKAESAKSGKAESAKSSKETDGDSIEQPDPAADIQEEQIALQLDDENMVQLLNDLLEKELITGDMSMGDVINRFSEDEELSRRLTSIQSTNNEALKVKVRDMIHGSKEKSDRERQLRGSWEDMDVDCDPWVYPATDKEAELLATSPGVWTIDSFLTNEEVDKLASLYQEHGLNAGDNPCSSFRFDHAIQCRRITTQDFFDVHGNQDEHEFFVNMRAKAHSLWPEFNPVEKHQFFDVPEGKQAPFHYRWQQHGRVATVNIFLTDDDGQGGKYVFPLTGDKVLTVSPKKGMVLTWLNVDADGSYTKKAVNGLQGTTPDSGKKLIFSTKFVVDDMNELSNMAGVETRTCRNLKGVP